MEPYCGDMPGDDQPSHSDGDALLDAMNDAISRGDVCLTQSLRPEPFLSNAATGAACSRVPRMPGWISLRGGLAEGWMWSEQAANLAEAKANLFASMSTEAEDGICDAARRTSYRQAGASRRGNMWVLFVAE
jgi:hypothetical protein